MLSPRRAALRHREGRRAGPPSAVCVCVRACIGEGTARSRQLAPRLPTLRLRAQNRPGRLAPHARLARSVDASYSLTCHVPAPRLWMPNACVGTWVCPLVRTARVCSLEMLRRRFA